MTTENVLVVAYEKVYHAAGRRYLTRSGALGGYARSTFMDKHPCQCEGADYDSGYPGYTCGVHEAWDRVKPRYLRWLRRQLKLKARESQEAPHTPQEAK